MRIQECLPAIAMALAISVSPASAVEETGLAALHSWVQVGSKTCIDGHWHYGEGTGDSRKSAEAKAVQTWIDFTEVDYGSNWMSHKLAVSKSMTCGKEGAGWNCTAAARACKPGAHQRPRKATKT